MSVCVVLTTMGFIVFPAMCAYALSGKSKAIGGVVAVTGLGAIAYTAVLNFWITPVNLPPPDNCSIVYPISVPLQTIPSVSIVTAISSIVGLSLATIVTWRKTRQSVAPPSGDSSTHRRANLPQLMFNYGMAYSCAVLTIDIVDVTLQALAFTEPGAADGDTYLSFFAGPITSILISRLMLDLFETNARMERGGASNTGSFSVNINSGNRGTRGRGRSGSPSMPIFLNPYSSGSLTQAQFSDVRDAVEYNRNTHDTANSACRESPPAESTHGEAVTYSSEGDGTIV
ncbi:hypothetical protein C8Q77DRAFT_831139 [Trametes polyzona]|nr:hypothetical protein C8Q77DRAFT_831139 [Trametes polyzona]